MVSHGGSTLAPVALCSRIARRPFVYRNIGDPVYWGQVRGANLRVGLPLRAASHVVALYDGCGAVHDRSLRTGSSKDHRVAQRGGHQALCSGRSWNSR